MSQYEEQQAKWVAREELAERMIPVIGRLYRRHGIVPSIHGRRLINCSPVEILKAHRFARLTGDDVLNPAKTLAVLETLASLDLGAASIDIARLVTRFDEQGGSYEGGALADFLRSELAEVVGAEAAKPTDVVLYGFGRIGRLIARILIARAGAGGGRVRDRHPRRSRG